MPLTDTAIKNTKPGAKAVRLFDGEGLYLELAPSGGRWWRLKYRFSGLEKRISLGTYPAVSLKAARDKRDEARQLLAAGVDPGADRKAKKAQARQEAASAFKAVALAWIKHKGGKWAPATSAAILASFEAHVFPELGALPIGELKARQVKAVVTAVDARGAGEAALRLLQRVRAVFRYAVTEELIETNPTLDLKPGEILQQRRVTHRAALPEAELPRFLRELDAYDGEPITVQALRLLMLTAVRPGELRGARWSEFDLSAARWRIPAERMKMGTEHLVPLASQAVELLQALQPEDGGGDGLVFGSPFYPGKPLSENTLNSALARMGYKGIATAHGFRALFSTVANECGHDPDVIERYLAHVQRNDVRAAYHRASYVAARAELAQWWADYIDGRRAGQVVPIGAHTRRRAAAT